MTDEITISELLQSANNLSKSKRYSEALPILQSILILDPNNALAWNAKGDAFDGLEKSQDALEAYDKAISINPNLASAWNGKGCALCKLGKYQDTLDVCNRALSIDPNVEDGWTKKGCALLKLGRYQEALDACNQALLIDPTSEKAKENRDTLLKNIKSFNASMVQNRITKIQLKQNEIRLLQEKFNNENSRTGPYLLGIVGLITGIIIASTGGVSIALGPGAFYCFYYSANSWIKSKSETAKKIEIQLKTAKAELEKMKNA